MKVKVSQLFAGYDKIIDRLLFIVKYQLTFSNVITVKWNGLHNAHLHVN